MPYVETDAARKELIEWLVEFDRRLTVKKKNKAAQQLGAKGGKSKSPAKKEAVRANLELARAARWPKKKPAN